MSYNILIYNKNNSNSLTKSKRAKKKKTMFHWSEQRQIPALSFEL